MNASSWKFLEKQTLGIRVFSTELNTNILNLLTFYPQKSLYLLFLLRRDS